MLKSFEKVAGKASALEGAAKSVGDFGRKSWIAAKGASKGLKAGLSEAGKGSVGDAVKMKGLGQGYDHVSKNFGKAQGIKGKSQVVGEALGKAAPSLAVAGAGAIGAKKVYDKAVGSNKDEGQYY